MASNGDISKHTIRRNGEKRGTMEDCMLLRFCVFVSVSVSARVCVYE